MLRIDANNVVEDRDVGLPRVAFPTPRAPDGCVEICVKYCTQTPKQRIIDYPLPDGTVYDGRPPLLLELCVNIMGTICYFFQQMWRNSELPVVPRVGCSTCQEILGDD